MVQVGEIRITVPGMNAAEAEQFGRAVVARISAGIPVNGYGGTKRISELNLQFRSSLTMQPAEMADQVAAKLLNQLKMA